MHKLKHLLIQPRYHRKESEFCTAYSVLLVVKCRLTTSPYWSLICNGHCIHRRRHLWVFIVEFCSIILHSVSWKYRDCNFPFLGMAGLVKIPQECSKFIQCHNSAGCAVFSKVPIQWIAELLQFQCWELRIKPGIWCLRYYFSNISDRSAILK